jgi:peptidyl-prolyl cis-trans isomerase A (cyclophilin A)
MLVRALAVVVLVAPLSLAQQAPATAPAPAQPDAQRVPDAARLVYIQMTTGKGEIVLELDRERAPITVENFLKYVERRAYDGTIFHRVIPGFVIQGGGHLPDLTEVAELDKGRGDPDVPIKNEWQNVLKNVRGSIAMARESEPDSATRQFYINVADNPRLDTAREQTGNAGYAVFGRVVAGMDVVDAIRQVPTREAPEKEMKDVPVEPVLIRKVRVMGESEAHAAIAREATKTGDQP